MINGVPTTGLVGDDLVKGNETDKLALLAVKSMITQDPLGVLNSWNNSANVCMWEGVKCGRLHNRVTVLDLSSYGLVGYLSPSIGNLSFLRDLRLPNNTFTGNIPPEVGRLVRLEKLVLLNNSFQGEIPTNISGCLHLVVLQLFNNKLVGKLPSGLSFLSKLETLAVGLNNLTGDDFSPLANLTSLQKLGLEGHGKKLGFSGRIPGFIGTFKNLIKLGLGGNSFTGEIPRSLYNLSNLQLLSLADNLLEGHLSPAFGLSFPQLQSLQMFDNRFSGPIPFSFSNLSNIEILDLRFNNFSGKILFDGRNIPYLSRLDIGAAIMGRGEVDELDFLNTLVNCTFLQFLNIYDNNLGGNISDLIVNLPISIIQLGASYNLISGSIPPGLSNLLNLEWLNLENNKLTGAIPSDIGMSPSLEVVYLENNLLSGRIPLSFGNLSSLGLLDLSYNKFHGLVPDTLGNCKNLIGLDLSHNNLVGFIPHTLFQASGLVELHLEENMLQGNLPDIGNLKNIVIIEISNNKLYGNIPSSLGQCLALTNLYFDGNFFDGFIPPSFEHLNSLQVIDLSNNRLSGQVPKYFTNFSYLTYLNLSFNNLEGEVPIKGVFANISAIFLVGNTKLCGGIPPLKLPRCTLSKLKPKKKSLARVIAISVSCFVVITIVSMAYLVCTKRKKQAPLETMSNKPFIQLSYEMLLKATNGFSSANLIGSGSFSSVYKGTIVVDEAEKSVAIKVFNNQRQGASQSFVAECEALRVIRHRNLVGVLTACSSIDYQGNEFNAIVYELMSKGSLERWLYTNPEVNMQLESLNLLQRLNIAIDVAHALDYIQNVCKTPFVHCDLKPSNILLDDDFVAHVGDFGLVKLPQEIVEELPNHISLGVRGTVGYTAPEYGLGASISAVGDVYSYGIVLLELLTATKPTDAMFEGDMSLHMFVESALHDQVLEILDPKLNVNNVDERRIDLDNTNVITNCAFECIKSMVMIGVRCSSDLPQDRMDIKDAIRQLEHQKRQLLLCGTSHRCQLIT